MVYRQFQICQITFPRLLPGHPKEEGLLDYLGRLGVAGSSVQVSRLVAVFSRPISRSRRCRAASKEIAGGQGKPRAPEIPGYPSGERVVRLLGTPGRGREQRSNVAIARDTFAASRWLQKVSSCVQGGLRRSGEASSSRTVA